MSTEEINNFWKERENDLNAMSLDDAKFVFVQAEKAYNDTIETAKKIHDRSYSILTLIITVTVGLVAFSTSRWEANKKLDPQLLVCVIGVFYYVLLEVFFVFKNILPTNYILPGTAPQIYFEANLFGKGIKTEDRLLALYKVEIINYNNRINFNRKLNDKRWIIYKKSLKMLLMSPFILGVVYIILSILR